MKNKSIKIAKISDIKFLFFLYNKGVSDGNFKRKKKVKYSDHKSWFSQSLKLNNIKTFILHYNKLKVGYVRVNFFKKKSVYISIILKKKFRKFGFGSYYLNKVIKIIKKFNVNQAYAEVLKNNFSSKLFFTNNGFRKIKYRNEFKFFFNKNNCIYFKKI